MYSYGPPQMAVQKQDDQLELTYSNYVRTQDVTLKTCRRRWMIGRSGERGSGISVLAARHDDDEWTKFPNISRRVQMQLKSINQLIYKKSWTDIINSLHLSSIPIKCDPVSWGCRIHRLLFCRGVRVSNECPVTQSAGAAEYADCFSAKG